MGYSFAVKNAKKHISNHLGWSKKRVGDLYKDIQECLSMYMNKNDFKIGQFFTGKLIFSRIFFFRFVVKIFPTLHFTDLFFVFFF